MWEYSPATKEWTWMGGPITTGGCASYPPYNITICTGWPGVYGEMGTPDAGNIPGGRVESASWSDSEGNLWLFGGQGIDDNPANAVVGLGAPLNDNWRFQPSTLTLPPAIAPELSVPSGSYSSPGTLHIASTMPNATFYYTTDGSTPTTQSTLYNGGIYVSTDETVKAIATVPGYRTSGVVSGIYFFSPLYPPEFSYGTGSYTPPISMAIWSWDSKSVVYYTLDGSTPTNKSARYKGPITITETTTVEAISKLAGSPASDVHTAVLTMLKLESITFTAPKSPISFTGKPVTLTLVAEASSGLPVTFSILSGPATVANSTLTIYGKGTVVVAADQQGDLIWNTAREVTHSITVN